MTTFVPSSEASFLDNAGSSSSVVVNNPWNERYQPKLKVNFLVNSQDHTMKLDRFVGNQTHSDQFKLLHTDGQHLLVGAQNVIYNLSLENLQEDVDKRITWNSLERDRQLCSMKGKSENECQNYIRVLAKPDSDKLLICGTNSFKPMCRIYNNTKSGHHSEIQVEKTFSGIGFSPYDPTHNSTFIYTDGELYSGTVADFSGTDALILRNRLRTRQFDLKHLNAPNFVSSMSDEDHVYFFFRESAVESINCGKTIYSRVGRICKKDEGGPSSSFSSVWTSFLKTRLICSIGSDDEQNKNSEQAFHFDHIQSTTTHMIDIDGGRDKLIYAVFTTSQNALSGSAICAFKFSDISRAFDEGPFKGQTAGSQSMWLPVPESLVPKPRPGRCTASGNTVPNQRGLNFIKDHSLMAEDVRNVYKRPLLIKTDFNERLTVIAVDSGVETGPEPALKFDVLYVGTTTGKVIKLVNMHGRRSTSHLGGSIATDDSVIVEEIQMFPHHIPITNVQVVVSSETSKKLVVLTEHEIKSIPVSRCSELKTCHSCVALQDPYCAWDLESDSCRSIKSMLKMKANVLRDFSSSLLQNVVDGEHEGCKDGGSSFKGSNGNRFLSTYNEFNYENEIDSNDLSSQQQQTTSFPSDSINHLNGINQPLNAASYSGSSVFQRHNTESFVTFLPSSTEMDVSASKSKNGSTTTISTEILTLASISLTVFSILLGFIIGFFVSKRCEAKCVSSTHIPNYDSCGHHYLEAQKYINRELGKLTSKGKGVGGDGSSVSGGESGYSTPPMTSSTSSQNSNTPSPIIQMMDSEFKRSDQDVNKVVVESPQRKYKQTDVIYSGAESIRGSIATTSGLDIGSVYPHSPLSSEMSLRVTKSPSVLSTMSNNGTLCKKVYV